MEGVKNATTKRAKGRGRARRQEMDRSEAYIAGQIANIGCTGLGSLSSFETNSNSSRKEETFAAVAVEELSASMYGVAINEVRDAVDVTMKTRARGRGRRIQKE